MHTSNQTHPKRAPHFDLASCPVSWAVQLSETIPLVQRVEELTPELAPVAVNTPTNLIAFDTTMDFYPTEGFHPRLVHR